MRMRMDMNGDGMSMGIEHGDEDGDDGDWTRG